MSRGLLLYGLLGTGKSYIASAIATNILNEYYPNQTTYIHVQARHIKEPEDVRNIFNGARIYTPCVLFFEDIDLIAGTDRKTKPEVKNELMQQLSGLESLKGVLVIGTTNTFETIDPALKRSQRLGYHFEIGLPIFEERQKLLEVFLRSYTNKVTVEGFASKTEGMTGADIKALIDNAYLRTKELGLEVITNEILEEALSDFKTNFIKP